MADLTSLTLSQAAAGLAAGEFSAVELAEAYLARIAALNPTLNAYVTVTAERAREDARRAAAEMAAGYSRGPLHGVSIGLKDLFDTAGIRTAGGAKIMAGRVPERDATVVARLREAGTVLLGKLNTHELAYGVTTTNPHFGATRNPWNTACIPGGSSGGSGAATAARLAAGTLGTDTGGSIRIPAALCGVVGLKPTYGRVSKAGVLPLSWQLDHVGPITRSVEDAALMLGAIAGYDAADPATVRIPVPDYTAELGRGVRGLRAGLPAEAELDRVHPEVRAAFEAAVEVLRGLGVEVRPDVVPTFRGTFDEALGSMLAEAQVIHAKDLAERPGDFGADVLALLSREAPDVAGLIRGQRAADAYAVAVRTALEEVDLLLTPTVAHAATPIGADTVPMGAREVPVRALMTAFTSQFNVARVPALALPCGFSGDGLPLSLQIAGRPFDEVTVLRAGHAYEQATEWHGRTPPL